MKYRITYTTETVFYVHEESIEAAAMAATQIVDDEYPGISFKIELDEE